MGEVLACPICKTEYESLPGKCSHCGYPFAGTDKEKSTFAAQQVLKQGQIDDAKDRIRQAQIVLFLIAAFNFVIPVLQYTNSKIDMLALILSCGIGLFFLIFGLLAKREPFMSILIPFILLIVSYILAAFANPATILSGIIWKVFFIGSLSYCLVRIKKAEKVKKESNYLASKNIN